MGKLILLASNLPSVLKKGLGLPLFPSILVIATALIFLSIFIHVLNKLPFKNRKEPPLVFSCNLDPNLRADDRVCGRPL
ncbi:hypothetical protein LPUS_00385 [Lasallia pustulata]|uniref:Uncharacterized protein n=1 Tax=Lasallia pustulata TaxID=136370 RepID=A0A1W5CXF5_9LECA|nr:hypothetical protein LPUS_00385 [Lasallia pustulata]